MHLDTPFGPGRAVVMVDDNPGDRVLARLCFERSLLEGAWLELSGGRALLDHLAAVKRGEAPLPSLVLLDINMPDMTGFEVLEAVRADAFFEALPVFCLLTSSADPRDRERGKALGASGFVTKPHDINDYIAFFDMLA